MAAALVAVLTYGGMIAISLYGVAERSTGGVVTSVDADGSTPAQEGARPPTESPAREDATPPTETSGTDDGASQGVVLLRFAVLMGLPALALVAALLAPTRRSAVTARSVAAVVLAAMTLLTITSVGIGFAVATGLMVAASVMASTSDATDRTAG